MAKLASDITDATLLCERCGYVLEGLDEAGACPECGQAIAESLPSRRRGTPFQVSPGWRGFVRQCKMLLTTPGSLFREMRFRHPEDLALCFCSVCIGSAPGAVYVFIAHPDREHRGYAGFEIIVAAMSVFALTAALLAALSWIELIGVDFFSRRRGWRVQRHVARAVCANAMPGWIPTGFFVAIGLMAMSAVQQHSYRAPAAMLPWLDTGAVAMPVLGFVCGMLVFETLVYIGVRRCKYANWVWRPVRGSGPAPALQAEETRTD